MHNRNFFRFFPKKQRQYQCSWMTGYCSVERKNLSGTGAKKGYEYKAFFVR
jgi:hypothetical protein